MQGGGGTRELYRGFDAPTPRIIGLFIQEVREWSLVVVMPWH